MEYFTTNEGVLFYSYTLDVKRKAKLDAFRMLLEKSGVKEYLLPSGRTPQNGRHITSELAEMTMRKALEKEGFPEGLILHSDRGSQFTSNRISEACRSFGVMQSMSKPGCPYDNSAMERLCVVQ